MSKRTLTENNTKLIGALVSVTGTILLIKFDDRSTTTHDTRKKKYMLAPVCIAGIRYNHLWIHSCNEIDHFKIKDKVSFTARLNTYQLKDKVRISIKFPYENISPPKPTYQGNCRFVNCPPPCQYIYPPVFLFNTDQSYPKYFPPRYNDVLHKSIQPRKVLKFTDLDFWGNRNSLELANSCG
uniref:Uncharacterized protein n=1 Tax=Pithovirus LCPAC202 TaxID=2506592 RepID=A0A481Z6T9_9VIRU|nr:MAG: uncharacterized protein LCPAC202_02390 [Pithovirus LCPAC202]